MDEANAFRDALSRIGLNPIMQEEIIAYTGCVNIAMLGLLTAEDISKMCKTFRTRANNPINVTVIQEQLILAIRFWVTNRQRLQKPIDAADVNAVMAYNQAQLMRHMLEDEARADKEQTAKMPDKFKTPSGWRVFAEALETYLMHLKGSGRIPLKYVIRRNTIPVPDTVYETEQEESIAIAPLIGDDFLRDNTRVYGIIKQLVLEGPGRSYIMPFDATSNGRAAWLSMVSHFEGESYRNRNVEDAYAALEALHYEGERKGFTFEKFVEKHNEAYLELERYNEPVLEAKKVRDFLRRINAPELNAAIQQVKATPTLLADFQQAVNFVALSVTPLKQSQRGVGALSRQPRREGTTISFDTQSTASSITDITRTIRGRGNRGRGGRFIRGGRTAGRMGQRGGRAGRGNISTGYYSPNDWAQLSREQQERILTQRGTKRNVSAISVMDSEYGYYDDGSHYSVYDGQDGDYQPNGNVNPMSSDEMQQVAAIASSEQSLLSGGSAGNEFGQRSRARYQDQEDARYIGMFSSSQRYEYNKEGQHNNTHTISKVHTNREPILAHLELDSHADTCTIGANCRILAYTNKSCEVSPYHPKYKAVQNVPIVQAGTAYTHPDTGITYILVINQALYMEGLPHTLLNPNQMRVNGIIVDDVPRHLAPDPNTATHSIRVPQHNLSLPLQLKGIISYLPSRIPTDIELETCTWIELTSDCEWDPHSNTFVEHEQRIIDGHDIVPPLKGRIIGSIQATHQLGDSDNETLEDQSSYLLPNSAELNSPAIHRWMVSSAKTQDRRFRITPQELASKWGIGVETAKKTLQATTQLAIRQAIHPIQRRFRTEIMQLRYPRLGGRHGKFHTDTFFSKVPSLTGCTMGQIYTNDINFTKFIPMKKKSDAPDTLLAFMQDVGIPSHLHSDDAKELTQGRMGEITRKAWIKTSQSEPYSPWQVRAELCNRELKKAVRYTMSKTRAPKRLWDYCTMHHSEIRNFTAHPLFMLQGRTPYELVTGNTPDISEYTDFCWYETVWYHDQEAAFPEDRRKLAKWLGVAHRVGQALCYYLLPASGRPIVRSTVQAISEDELHSENICQQIKELDQQIESSIIESKHEPPLIESQNQALQDVYEPYEPDAEKPEVANFTPNNLYDALISAEVILPKGDILAPATVTRRKRDVDGNPVGTAHPNPILDTRVYEVEFPDGHTEEYAANIIAQNVYSQVDAEGRRYLLLDEIINHNKDHTAIHADDKWIQKGANKQLKRTTQGWKLQVRWKDGSTSWEPLRNLKESNPVEVAEYAINNKIAEEAAFAWWVPFTLRQRDRIIKSIRSKATHKKTHKFGLEIPTTVKRALEIDKETGTNFWAKAIEKEMFHVSPAFEILKRGEKAPLMSKWIPCHMIFDIRMDFTRKARFVAGGHVTDPPTAMTYSSVVARDSVRLAFLIASLNDIDILAADIGNAYLNAYTQEKVHTTCGPEFGSQHLGCVAVIRKALYGLKSSGAAWRSLFASTLQDMGYKATLADPDVWLSRGYRKNGTPYYRYIFVYVDDILVLAENPQEIMAVIAKSYRLKNDNISEPSMYLGAQMRKHTLPEHPTKQMWSMSAERYVKEAIRGVEIDLKKIGKQLPSRVTTPLSGNYRPELDMSPILDADYHHWYQQLLGTLRWAVELGRIDIHLPVALMAQHLAQPRTGHLDQVLHIFAYLKLHSRSRIILDDTEPRVDESRFPKVQWEAFYPDAMEAIPPNAPEPLGNPVILSCFVDADHAGNQVTRRSHTGIILFCNRAPIIWFSKKQNTVETSTFGSEFVALRIAVELIEGLRYKLRMFGVPIKGPANVYCDNAGVVVNSQMPQSTLKRKHNSIAYHRVREAAAAGTIRVAKEHNTSNIADMLTKVVSGPRLRDLCMRVLF